MADNTKELTLVGNYASFVKEAAHILEHAERGLWSPATMEFKDIAKQGGTNPTMVSDLMNFLDTLIYRDPARKEQPRPQGSLKRVNLITHANPEKISLKGTISVGKGGIALLVDFADDPTRDFPDNPSGIISHSISAKSLNAMRTLPKEKLEASRRVFAKNGQLFIYACRAGVKQTLIDQIHGFFQIEVFSFKDLIQFCPTDDAKQVPKGIRRGSSGLFYRMGEVRCKQGLFDFHKLVTTAGSS